MDVINNHFSLISATKVRIGDVEKSTKTPDRPEYVPLNYRS